MNEVSESILEAVHNVLAALPEAERQQLLSTVITELLNSSGIAMDGGMVQSPLPESPEMVGRIAALLSQHPALTRNKYAIYPFVRPSLSASGPCFYMDAKTGELFVLLLRRLKDSHQWLYPAGYMEVMPSNTQSVYSERVSENVRNKAEEATIGVHLDMPEWHMPPAEIHALELPDGRAVQFLVYEEFRRLVALEGWGNAVSRISDTAYIQDLLARHRTHWPAHMDFSSKATFVRETREEAGLDLAAYPDATVRLAKSMDTISLGSGGERLYNTDQLHFAWLGLLETAPKLTPGANEVKEAGWIPVRDIDYMPDRNQYVVKKDGRLLHFHAIPGLEYTLYSLLSLLIAQVSRIRKPENRAYVSLFENAASLQAALIRSDLKPTPALRELTNLDISKERDVTSLVSEKGQAVFRSFIAAAHAVTAKKDITEIEQYATSAKMQPELLLGILRRAAKLGS